MKNNKIDKFNIQSYDWFYSGIDIKSEFNKHFALYFLNEVSKNSQEDANAKFIEKLSSDETKERVRTSIQLLKNDVKTMEEFLVYLESEYP